MQAILATIALAVIFYFGKLLFFGASSEVKPVQTPPAQMPPAQVQSVPFYTAEQEKEMTSGFHQVMSDVLKPLYAGCSFKGLEQATVYVSDDWQNFSAEQKKGIIDRVFKIYAGMLSVRNMKTIIQSMEIKFVLKSSNAVVGSWDSYRGVVVN